jgi:hypothetical protein
MFKKYFLGSQAFGKAGSAFTNRSIGVIIRIPEFKNKVDFDFLNTLGYVLVVYIVSFYSA